MGGRRGLLPAFQQPQLPWPSIENGSAQLRALGEGVWWEAWERLACSHPREPARDPSEEAQGKETSGRLLPSLPHAEWAWAPLLRTPYPTPPAHLATTHTDLGTRPWLSAQHQEAPPPLPKVRRCVRPFFLQNTPHTSRMTWPWPCLLSCPIVGHWGGFLLPPASPGPAFGAGGWV